MKSGIFSSDDPKLMDIFFDRFYKGLEYRVFLKANESANRNMMGMMRKNTHRLTEMADLII